MIYDTIKAIGRYKGISKNLDTAILFLENEDLTKLPLGKTIIDGERVFINVMEAQTAAEESLNFEIHKKYMDIQIDIEGAEIIQIGLDKAEPLSVFKEEADIGMVDCRVSASCTMGSGRFILCMKEEPHRPGIMVDRPSNIKKCVIKVCVE